LRTTADGDAPFADRQMGSTAMHRWWYRQLEKAGIVATGETSGERMRKARHTAGQRVLEGTGDLKLTQRAARQGLDPDNGRYLRRL
jgi:hypothetical protein